MLMRKGIDIYFFMFGFNIHEVIYQKLYDEIYHSFHSLRLILLPYLKKPLFKCLFLSSPDPKAQIRHYYANGAASSSVHTVHVV